jgi:uncharacterized protein (TIGR02588 family)
MSKATENNLSQTQDQHRDRSGQQNQQQQGRSVAEWVSFGISTAILLAVAGLILFWWLTAPKGPPIIRISPAGDIRQVEEQFYVPFEVKNTGGSAADAIQARAELRINGQVVEQATQSFSFLSRGETEKGAFVFTQDPREGKLTMSITSYKQP